VNQLFLGIGIAGVSTAAFAADMALKAPPPAVAPPPYNWNGCYIGGNVGGKWWTHTSGNLDLLPGFLTSTTSFDLSGNNSNGSFIGGGQVGCNYQSGQFVFGIEGDADWQHLSRTETLVETSGAPGFTTNGSLSFTSDWQASIRGRIGYAADRVLWYATGGVAWTNVSVSGRESFSFPTSAAAPPEVTNFDIASISKTAFGGTAGVGVEFAVADQVTLGLEGRYTWYGSVHFNTVANEDAVVSAPGSLNLNTAEVIGKLNWKFGGNEERREQR
jgi:outer membrane immunogenic protein